jgi:hypothetical protein
MKPVRIVALLLATTVAMAADVYDTDSELGKRYGYLVLDTIVGRPATNWQLSDGLVIKRLPLGRDTRLLRLREGSYRWEEIDVPYFDLPHRIDTSDDSRWSFTVKRQKINYAGTLIIDETRASDAVGVRFVNRSSEIVARLREKYPDHVAMLGVRFAGSYRDDYLALESGEVANASAK